MLVLAAVDLDHDVPARLDGSVIFLDEGAIRLRDVPKYFDL